MHRRLETVPMRKLTVLLLASMFVLGTVLPATAEPLIIDSWNVERIQFHLNTAIDALKKPNLLKAQNHINWAMGLLPSSAPVVVGWFKIVTPFTWDQSSGPMPVQVGAMWDDGTPQPLFTGTVILSLPGGSIVTLYDQHMVKLPSTQTTNFFSGSWQGYVVLRTPTGSTETIGLRASDPISQVGGN